jgi:hypothetical protein
MYLRKRLRRKQKRLTNTLPYTTASSGVVTQITFYFLMKNENVIMKQIKMHTQTPMNAKKTFLDKIKEDVDYSKIKPSKTKSKLRSIQGMKKIPTEPETWYWGNEEYLVNPDMSVYRIEDGNRFIVPKNYTFSYNDKDFAMIVNYLTLPIPNYLLPSAIDGKFDTETKVCSDLTVIDPDAFTRFPKEVTLKLTEKQYSGATRFGIKATHGDPLKGCTLSDELVMWGVYKKGKLVGVVHDTSLYGVELAIADRLDFDYDVIEALGVCTLYDIKSFL